MPTFWISLGLVASGGALGASLRYLVALLLKGIDFPLSTLIVNVLGSFLIGLFAGLIQHETGLVHDEQVPFTSKPGFRLFFITGLLGGFTTFSAFSLETMGLFQAGEPIKAAFNVILSNGIGIAAAFVGYAVAVAMRRG